jgi:hypothetical protein
MLSVYTTGPFDSLAQSSVHCTISSPRVKSPMPGQVRVDALFVFLGHRMLEIVWIPFDVLFPSWYYLFSC